MFYIKNCNMQKLHFPFNVTLFKMASKSGWEVTHVSPGIFSQNLLFLQHTRSFGFFIHSHFLSHLQNSVDLYSSATMQAYYAQFRCMHTFSFCDNILPHFNIWFRSRLNLRRRIIPENRTNVYFHLSLRGSFPISKAATA